MRKPILAMCLSVWAMSGVIAAPVSDQARALLERGNDAASRGDWDIAETMYRDAAALEPTRAEALFNHARSLHGMERLEDAERVYAEALRHAADRPDIAARALFNLADLSVRRADAVEGENPQEAVDALREASRRYRDARALAPGDDEAARNVEAVNRRIQALRDQMAQDKANREALEELARELEELAQEQEENQSPSQDDGEGEPQQGEAGEPGEQGGQQGDPAGDGAGQQNQQGQQGQPGRPDPLAERTREAAQAAEQLAEQMENAAESRGAQTSPAADSLRTAAERLQEAAQQREESRSADREGRPDEASSRREASARETRDAERIVRQLLEQAREQESEQDQQQGQSEENQEEGAEGQGQESGEQQAGQQPQGGEGDSSAFDGQSAEQTSVDRLLDRERRVREALERARRPLTGPRPAVERDW